MRDIQVERGRERRGMNGDGDGDNETEARIVSDRFDPVAKRSERDREMGRERVNSQYEMEMSGLCMHLREVSSSSRSESDLKRGIAQTGFGCFSSDVYLLGRLKKADDD